MEMRKEKKDTSKEVRDELILRHEKEGTISSNTYEIQLLLNGNARVIATKRVLTLISSDVNDEFTQRASLK